MSTCLSVCAIIEDACGRLVTSIIILLKHVYVSLWDPGHSKFQQEL